mmetsp:Transcript_49859/g.125570  ORF Transcript_49859/g.125570 Transcript_49859/m.125570 type:complete len:217 (+) Transcript_49859:642-1292(+)
MEAALCRLLLVDAAAATSATVVVAVSIGGLAVGDSIAEEDDTFGAVETGVIETVVVAVVETAAATPVTLAFTSPSATCKSLCDAPTWAVAVGVASGCLLPKLSTNGKPLTSITTRPAMSAPTMMFCCFLAVETVGGGAVATGAECRDAAASGATGAWRDPTAVSMSLSKPPRAPAAVAACIWQPAMAATTDDGAILWLNRIREVEHPSSEKIFFLG